MMARPKFVRVVEPSLEFERFLHLVLSMFSRMSGQYDGDLDGEYDEFLSWIGVPLAAYWNHQYVVNDHVVPKWAV